MERNVLNVGDTVAVTEGKLPRAYYYTAEPAAAMSKNFAPNSRIRSDHGTVVKKELEGITQDALRPIKENYKEIRESEELLRVLRDGADRAGAIAEKTMKRVRDKFGMGF